jgi:general secretion pathway protein C
LHAFDHNPAMLQTSPAPTNAKLWPGAGAALLWCAAAASAVFWVLNFPSGRAVQGVPLVHSAGQATAASALQPSVYLARAWGVQAPAPEVSIAQSSRFQLWGVVAGASGQGSALIAVDGQPPRAFRVGQTVTDGVVLQSLGPKQAQLGVSAQGAVLFSLSLPGTDKAP